MAAIATAYKFFRNVSNTAILYAHPSSTLAVPRLLRQSIKGSPSSDRGVYSVEFRGFKATKDEEGVLLPERTAFTLNIQVPVRIGSTETAVTDVLADLRELVASDNLDFAVGTGKWFDQYVAP